MLQFGTRFRSVQSLAEWREVMRVSVLGRLGGSIEDFGRPAIPA